jgi:hypothetical protein
MEVMVLKIPRMMTPFTGSVVGVLRPLVSRVARTDGQPAEMKAPRLAAALVPQVYRPRSGNLMRCAPLPDSLILDV